MTFEFDVWPWKTIGHLFYSTSSFVHHFVAIGEFKLELQSGNAWLSAIWRFLESCDLEIWCMTLKINRAPLLCYFKLCVLFRIHQWFQTGETVRKRPIWVKISPTDDKPVVGKVHDVSFDVTTPIGLTSVGWMSMVQPKGFKWGLWVQKLVSRAWISNYIKHNIMGCNCLSMPYIPVSGTKVLKKFLWFALKITKKFLCFYF